MARQFRASRKLAGRAPASTARRRPWNVSAKHLDWIIATGLILLAAVAYAQVIGFEFTNYDDTAYVPDNLHVRDGFSLGGIGWAFTTFETANWYPLTWLSLMLDCQVFGPRPGAIHAVNALLHAADGVLLFVALKRMTGRRWPSAAVAALFAVHPLHVESVAWIAERKDVLSTLFFLLTLSAYCRYVARPSFGRWTLVFLSMAAGLLCKPMLVTLPFLLLLLDYWPLGRIAEREKGRKGERENLSSPPLPFSPSPFLSPLPLQRISLSVLLLEKLPLLALSAAASVLTMFAQASQGATKMIGEHTMLPLRFANAAIAYVKYLTVTFWPADLAVFYPYDFHPRPLLVIASLAILAPVTFAVLVFVRRAPYLTVGWFWYLGTLAPTIGIVQVGAQALADRYTYIPSIGIFIAIVWTVAEFAHRPFTVAVGFAVAIAGFLVAAHCQVAYWTNSEMLFRHALAVTGDNAVSCENLGDALLHHERYAEAEKEFRKVLAMDAKQFSQTPGELARALAGQNRIGEAIALDEAISDDLEKAKAMNDLALLLVSRSDYAEAIQLLEEAVRLEPKQPAALNNLANGYATCPDERLRNGAKAVALARRACELTDWTNAQYRVTLADAYLECGDREHAIEELRAAKEFSPADKALAARLDAMLQ